MVKHLPLVARYGERNKMYIANLVFFPLDIVYELFIQFELILFRNKSLNRRVKKKKRRQKLKENHPLTKKSNEIKFNFYIRIKPV